MRMLDGACASPTHASVSVCPYPSVPLCHPQEIVTIGAAAPTPFTTVTAVPLGFGPRNDIVVGVASGNVNASYVVTVMRGAPPNASTADLAVLTLLMSDGTVLNSTAALGGKPWCAAPACVCAHVVRGW